MGTSNYWHIELANRISEIEISMGKNHFIETLKYSIELQEQIKKFENSIELGPYNALKTIELGKISN